MQRRALPGNTIQNTDQATLKIGFGSIKENMQRHDNRSLTSKALVDYYHEVRRTDNDPNRLLIMEGLLVLELS